MPNNGHINQLKV